jgi:hypothetical protein
MHLLYHMQARNYVGFHAGRAFVKKLLLWGIVAICGVAGFLLYQMFFPKSEVRYLRQSRRPENVSPSKGLEVLW